MRILVFGQSGQVAQSLRQILPDAVFIDRARGNFLEPRSLTGILNEQEPEVVINAAAYTAVDRAEAEPIDAMTINATAPKVIATWCAAKKCSLLHYSTDYVYSGTGDKAWREDDRPDPTNTYGQSKLRGEDEIRASGCHHIILRTSWVYSAVGSNFARTMIRLGMTRESLSVVNDQFGAPTFAPDLARATVDLLRKQAFKTHSGIYNFAGDGTTSWFGFAEAIFAWCRRLQAPLKLKHLVPIATSAYPTPARRPHNSRLNLDKLRRDFDIYPRKWQTALDEGFESILAGCADVTK